MIRPLRSLPTLAAVLLLSLFACSEEKSATSTAAVGSKISISEAKADVQLAKLKLPEGFKIDVWAADVPNARSMAISESGIVFVGNRQEKNVYALVDENGDGKVSKEEFKKAQNAMAEKMAESGKDFLKKAFAGKPELHDKMFAAMDTNKDGFLDLEEYKTGREKSRELMKEIFKKKE